METGTRNTSTNTAQKQITVTLTAVITAVCLPYGVPHSGERRRLQLAVMTPGELLPPLTPPPATWQA